MGVDPKMTCDVIVVLGGDNLPDGTLTPMMRARADVALRLWRKTPGTLIVTTGGFGKFNGSKESHAAHVARYLRAQGVPAAAFLPSAVSAHTVEDAALTQKVLAAFAVKRIRVVTSRFHGPRAQFIFAHFFAADVCSFVLAPSKRPLWRLWRHWRHEKKWLRHLQQQGGVWVKEGFLPTPVRL